MGSRRSWSVCRAGISPVWPMSGKINYPRHRSAEALTGAGAIDSLPTEEGWPPT